MADPTAATPISALSHCAEFKGFGELQELQVKVQCGLRWVRKEEVDVKTNFHMLARLALLHAWPSLTLLLFPFIWFATGWPWKYQLLANYRRF